MTLNNEHKVDYEKIVATVLNDDSYKVKIDRPEGINYTTTRANKLEFIKSNSSSFIYNNETVYQMAVNVLNSQDGVFIDEWYYKNRTEVKEKHQVFTKAHKGTISFDLYLANNIFNESRLWKLMLVQCKYCTDANEFDNTHDPYFSLRIQKPGETYGIYLRCWEPGIDKDIITTTKILKFNKDDINKHNGYDKWIKIKITYTQINTATYQIDAYATNGSYEGHQSHIIKPHQFNNATLKLGIVNIGSKYKKFNEKNVSVWYKNIKVITEGNYYD